VPNEVYKSLDAVGEGENWWELCLHLCYHEEDRRARTRRSTSSISKAKREEVRKLHLGEEAEVMEEDMNMERPTKKAKKGKKRCYRHLGWLNF